MLTCQSLSHVWLSMTPWANSLPGSLVHGVLQARILKRVAIPFSRGSSPPRDQTWASCIAGRFFISWASGEAPVYHKHICISQHVCSPSLSHSWLFGIPWTAAHQGLHLPLVSGGIYWPQTISWPSLWNCSRDTLSQKFNLIFKSAKAAVGSSIPGSGRWPGEGNGNPL